MVSTLLEEAWLVPDEVPTAPHKLTGLDCKCFSHPPMCPTVYCIRGHLDTDRLKESFCTVLMNNPILIGRTFGGAADGLEIRFDGKLGCPLYIKRLPEEVEDKVADITFEKFMAEYMEYEFMFERLGFEYAAAGDVLVRQEAPLCCGTYIAGANVSLITLSVCHMIADAWSVHALTRVWHEEYMSPGSSKPLSTRNCMLTDGVDYWKHIGENVDAEKDAACCFMLKAGFTEDVLQKLKAEEMRNLPPGSVISGNDALCAWVANALKSKYFAVMTSTRGRYPGVPVDCLGNCAAGVTSDECKSPVTALDVRRTLETMLERKPWPRIQMPQDEYFVWNNWSKIMYNPDFGGKMYQAIPLIDLNRLTHSGNSLMHIVHQANAGEYMVIHRGLRLDQALLLKAQWASLGATHTHIIFRQHAGELFRKAQADKQNAVKEVVT